MTSAYLGPAGNLVEFKCPSDEQIGLGDRVKLKLTVDGTQQAQYTRKSPRAWQVGIGTATPEQVAQLNALAHGLYGPPPYVYVGPWAQVTNLLAPAASMLKPGSWSGLAEVAVGAVWLEDGTRPAVSLTRAAGADVSVPAVPVVPGMPVTGSAWAMGNPGVYMSLEFRNATGQRLALVEAGRNAPIGGALKRVSLTALPPAGAVDVVLRVAEALRVALPAITWTPDVAVWGVGGGAPKVVQRGLSEAVQLAVRDEPGLRRSSLSFVLEEVGNA